MVGVFLDNTDINIIDKLQIITSIKFGRKLWNFLLVVWIKIQIFRIGLHLLIVL